MVNKMKNPKPSDEPRMAFDYSRVHENLSATFLELSSKVSDHLLDFNYGCLFIADFEYIYAPSNSIAPSRQPLFRVHHIRYKPMPKVHAYDNVQSLLD